MDPFCYYTINKYTEVESFYFSSNVGLDGFLVVSFGKMSGYRIF
jgi:hypothetical protein